MTDTIPASGAPMADTHITTAKPVHTPITDLMVANFRTEPNLTDNLRAWMSESDVAAAMSCARQVWFGDTHDFASFPETERAFPGMSIMTGQEAYAFLVRLKTGLESNNLGETNITGDFNAGWLAFTKARPEKAETLQFMMNCITGDSRWIRKHVANLAQPTTNELVARVLSGQQPHESAFIIGTTGNKGLSKSTNDMMRAIGNNKVGTVSEIILAHPDPQVCKDLYRHAREMRSKKYLDASVSVASFDYDTLVTAMDLSDRIYVDLPMGLNPKADELLITAWQNRENRDNTLTHIRGRLERASESAGAWVDAKLDNYISPEALFAERGTRLAFNEKLIERGDLASHYCAAARMARRQPEEKIIAAIAAGDDAKAGPALAKLGLCAA